MDRLLATAAGYASETSIQLCRQALEFHLRRDFCQQIPAGES